MLDRPVALIIVDPGGSQPMTRTVPALDWVSETYDVLIGDGLIDRAGELVAPPC